MINNLETLYNSTEEVFIFVETILKCYLMLSVNCNPKQNETKGTGLQILTPKEMLQRLPIALAQVKAGNNSESLLNESRKTVYSLY